MLPVANCKSLSLLSKLLSHFAGSIAETNPGSYLHVDTRRQLRSIYIRIYKQDVFDTKRNTYFGSHKSALIFYCLSNTVVVRVLLNRQSDLKLRGCGLGNLT